MIAVIDYGVGNLFSLVSSLASIGEEAILTDNEKVLESADRIILPGVGAFRDAAEKLNDSGLVPTLINEVQKGKPLLGICLGMQLLFDRSYENGEYNGLGLIPGDVIPLKGAVDAALKIPHIGWNTLEFSEDRSKSSIYKYIDDNCYVYFVHSFFASDCSSYISSYTDYGIRVTASVEKDNVFGVQYHPEKSGKDGLSILKAFCEL